MPSSDFPVNNMLDRPHYSTRFLTNFVLWLLVISTATFGQFVTGRPPILSSASDDLVQISQGQSLTLDCPVDEMADGELQIHWRKFGQPVVDRKIGRNLSISAVSRSDDGAYRCVAENALGALLSRTINVSVNYMDGFEKVDKAYYRTSATVGGYFVLSPPTLLANPSSEINWRWYFVDSVIFLNRTHFISSAGDLVVVGARESFSGAYRVEASSNDGRVVSDDFNVEISSDGKSLIDGEGDPIIVLPPRDTTFVRSTNQKVLILECVANSRSVELQIVWHHNGTRVVPDGIRFQLEHFNRRLRVKNPSYPIDSGLYVCEATRASNSVRAQAWINIYQKPEISSEFDDETPAPLGQQFELPCATSGWPRPNITWYRNAEITTATNHITEDGSLRIDSIRDSDAGVYQCEAKNFAGSDLATTWLKVESARPILTVKPTNVSVAVGESIVLKCSAKGAPVPKIMWQLGESDVLIDGVNYRIDDDTGGLLLPSAKRSQHGLYMCIAKNSEGSVSASAFITVTGKNLIEIGPNNQSVVIGSNVIFSCQLSDSISNINITRNWYFNDRLLLAGANRKIDLRDDGSLFIRQVGPASIGEYTCTVTSSIGVESVGGYLNIIEKPGMPLQPIALLINDTIPAMIRVQWSEGFDGNSPIIKYLVQSRSLGASGLWSDWEPVMDNVAREERHALLDNLKPSATFEFRIIAVNRYGSGIPSLSSNNITMPQQPPAAAPRNVAASARSSTSVMVQWQPPPPDQWNGDILGYVVRYRLADYTGIPWLERNISDNRARNLPLDDLITWREYEVQLAAYNDRGMGVFSKPMFVTTLEGVPTEPPKLTNVSVLNSTAVYVEFVPPTQQMIPGVNQGYKIEFWKGTPVVDKLFKTIRVLPEVSIVRRTISDLEKYGHYNVTVLCFTAPGDGPRSPSIEVQTLEDVPGVVENMHFDQVLFSSVQVVWDAPNEPNGKITKYTLRYWPVESDKNIKTIEIDPNDTMFVADGLKSATTYKFELFASTAIGDGPIQDATMESGVPPAIAIDFWDELPGRPTSLIVSDIRARSVNLQFVPGFDGKTIISKWIVEGRIGSSTAWTLVYNISSPKARSMTVERLRPYTKYELRLIAENIKGRGAPSDSTRQFETPQAEPESAPIDLAAEPNSANSIVVSWTPLHSQSWNGNPRGYLLMYRRNDTDEDSNDWKELRISNIKTSEFTIGELNAYSDYMVKIFAENTFGRSRSSDIVDTRTYEDVPSSPPRNVQAIATISTSIRVTWEALPFERANGEILGYRVRYIPEEERLRKEAGELEVVGSDARRATVDNLRSYTSYRIHVAAFTVIGSGPPNPTAILVQTGEDTPGPPSNVAFNYVSENEVRIRWQPPYRPNGRIIHYEISYWKTDSVIETAVRAQLPEDVYVFAATQLANMTSYMFAVKAETSVGWGESSEVLVFTTSRRVPPPTPSMPGQSITRQQAANSMWIRWDMTSNVEAPVRLVDVEYQQLNTADWVRWPETFAGSGTEALIDGLFPSTAYRSRIRFTNDFGQSQWSLESAWMKTLESVPLSAPSNIEAIPYESSTLKIRWRPPPIYAWNSDYVGYRILYRPYPSNDTYKTEEIALSGERSLQMERAIAGLDRFKHYLLRMQTFNQQGSSPSSAPTFVYVGYAIPKLQMTDVTADAVSSTLISVRWDAWKHDLEPISGYKIRYKPLDIDEPASEEVVAGDKTSTLLNDLHKYTKYEIVISPYNKAGVGPKSTIVSTTLEDRPGPTGPLVFTDILLNSANVSWTSPEQPNGRITGYIVNYRTFKLKEEFKKEIQEKTTLNYLMAGNLEENVTYFFTVRAETSAGYGPETNGNVTIGPTRGSPQHPHKPRISQSHSSVTLQWTDGDEGETPITGHIIQAKRLRRSNEVIVNEQTASTPSLLEMTLSRRRDERAMMTSSSIGPNHPIGVWIILTSLQGRTPTHEISYRELEPASYYTFRLFARNTNGVSYPSPDSDQVQVPEFLLDDPFYTKWWFLVILALASLVIILVVVALLCVTGGDNKYKYEKRNSADSLQLADGGIVSYELRASQRPNKNTRHHHSRTDWRSTSRSSSTDLPAPPAYGSVIVAGNNNNSIASSSRAPAMHATKPPSVYGSLATDVVASRGNVDRYGCTSQMQLVDDFETSTTADGSGDESDDRETSIAQHYETTDAIYRDTWRRAKLKATREQLQTSAGAAAGGGGGGGGRPPSVGSQQSDSIAVATGHVSTSIVGRTPLPGFSSFV